MKLIPFAKFALFSALPVAAFPQTLYVPSGTAGIGSSSTSHVGVGVNNPSEKLHVGGNLMLNGSLLLRGGGQLEVQFYNWDAPADQHFSEIIDQNGRITFRTVNDAYTLGSDWLRVFRASGSHVLDRIVFPAGNVGIGTDAPLRPLHLYSTSGWTEQIWESAGVPSSSVGRIWRWGADPSGNFSASALNGSLSTSTSVLVLSSGGYVGIGTAGPAARLDVRGLNAQDTYSVSSSVPEDLRVLSSNNRPLDGGVITIGGAWGPTGYIKTTAHDGRAGSLIIGNRRSPNDETMQPGIVLHQSGRVGVGTTDPSHALSVNGTIRAKEVIVDTGWADYVFADDYRLAPLTEVEAHIKEHKHLPGIPSSAQVAEQGVGMGEMQARIMAKLEEVTLHLIAQEKELSQLKQENSTLKGRVNELEAAIK